MKIMITLPRPIVGTIDEIAKDWGGWDRSDAIYELIDFALKHFPDLEAEGRGGSQGVKGDEEPEQQKTEQKIVNEHI